MGMNYKEETLRRTQWSCLSSVALPWVPVDKVMLQKCYQASHCQLRAMYAWPFHTIFSSITDRAWVIATDNSRTKRLCLCFPMTQVASWRGPLHESEGTGGSAAGSPKIISHCKSQFCLRSQWPESSMNYASLPSKQVDRSQLNLIKVLVART